MFVKTFKIRKPGILLLGAGAALLALIVIATVLAGGSRTREYPMKTEEQRQSFLKEMGWEVPEEYDECKVVIIPSEFNDVYKNYNELQKKQGFDLEKYKGRTVEIYSYTVKNYPDHENNIICSLMVCDGTLIGGDVSCVELDGFMQGLKAQTE